MMDDIQREEFLKAREERMKKAPVVVSAGISPQREGADNKGIDQTDEIPIPPGIGASSLVYDA